MIWKLSLITVLIINSGCSTLSRSEFCKNSLEDLEVEITEAMIEVKRGHGLFSSDQQGRRLASVVVEDSPERNWEKWALSYLSQAQAAADQVKDVADFSEDRTDLSLGLNSISNQAVTFYGYAERRDQQKMLHSLNLMKNAKARIDRKYCK